MRDNVIKEIEEKRLIAIVRGVGRERLIPLCEALFDGGIRLVEMTYSADGAVSDTDTAECIGMLCKHFRGRMTVGAGTVLTAEQVRLTAEMGGRFIISPNTDPDVIRATRELRLVSIPGALTPTEIQTAHLMGADFVKLFPISSLGSEYVRAVRAPMSHVRLLAVGGVDTENMRDYLASGVSGFGLGSNIVDKKMLLAGDTDGITALARKYTEIIDKWERT